MVNISKELNDNGEENIQDRGDVLLIEGEGIPESLKGKQVMTHEQETRNKISDTIQQTTEKAEDDVQKEDLKPVEKNLVLLKQRPQDEIIANPKEKDLPPIPAPVQWKSPDSQEIFTAYPALFHQLSTRKGYIDRWMIRWFDTKEEAAEIDAKYRGAAESYENSRHRYNELTKGVEKMKLPLVIPEMPEIFLPKETFGTPQFTSPREILEMAGFSDDQCHVSETEYCRYYEGRRGYRDPDSGWEAGTSDRVELVWKNEDGIWEIGKTGMTNLLEKHHVMNVFVPSVLSSMGMSQEEIDSLKEQVEIKNKQIASDFLIKLQNFIEELEELPVFHCLPISVQKEVEEIKGSCEMGFFSSHLLKRLESVQEEWGIAEKLQGLQEQGEILVNWGGFFREVGRTGNKQYWTIMPDGSDRYPDIAGGSSTRYDSSGRKLWRIIFPEELAISWSKNESAAPHEFVIEHMPTNGLTPEQLATVSELEEKISQRWKGAVGFSSRIPSPSIGEGWGITGRKPETEPEINEEIAEAVVVPEYKTNNDSGGETAMEAAMRKAGLLK